jgi:hypothetical protein
VIAISADPDAACTAPIKRRDILFEKLHDDPHQAETATRVLGGLDGIRDVRVSGPLSLEVTYDLSSISLEVIEGALLGLGFHLHSTLLAKLKRTLYYYAEDTQRANMDCERGESNCTRRVFMSRYRRLQHGCRDGRLRYWRNYH